MQIGFSPKENRKNKHLNITSVYNRSFHILITQGGGLCIDKWHHWFPPKGGADRWRSDWDGKILMSPFSDAEDHCWWQPGLFHTQTTQKQLPQAIYTSSVFTCPIQFQRQTSWDQASCQMLHCKNVWNDVKISNIMPDVSVWAEICVKDGMWCIFA